MPIACFVAAERMAVIIVATIVQFATKERDVCNWERAVKGKEMIQEGKEVYVPMAALVQ